VVHTALANVRDVIVEQHEQIDAEPAHPVTVAKIGVVDDGMVDDHRKCDEGTRAVEPVSWSREFDDPIPLPRDRRLVTLQDAGNFITKLPKAEHEAAGWQAPTEAMIVVATLGRPVRAHRRHAGIEPARRPRGGKDFAISRMKAPNVCQI
jgi:hypothetical protein